MAYQALYRVWRPQSFVDVVGQEHVTKTLQNALQQQKISHAYLFSGPRGTGKTSAAKILAKAINCEHAPTSEPCNQCNACLGITKGTISDVMEIDAASNNGVDEIRDIRDKVKFAPSEAAYKVYIIDEVHMLSIGAFNALLKTLEEPPAHVIFILATTEPHKIPSTIISRCQRFDFKRITSFDIVRRMEHIANETALVYEEQALSIIARGAEGGMRDALSLLDQAVSLSEDKVTVDDALIVTGSISQSHLHHIARAFLTSSVADALDSLEQLLFQGKDANRLVEDLILYFRDMLLYQTAPNLEEAIERVELDETFQDLSKQIEMNQIYTYIDTLNKAKQEMRLSNLSRVYLEVAFIKLCETTPAPRTYNNEQLSMLEQKIRTLESELQSLKNGTIVQSDNQQNQTSTNKKPARSTGGYRVQEGKIREVLQEASKQNLVVIKQRWSELLDTLNARQMRSQAALLNEAEPAASSDTAIVIKFKYEIHCQMAMQNQSFQQAITSILGELTGKDLSVLGIPAPQWDTLREKFIKAYKEKNQDEQEATDEEDPLVSEAMKLVGSDLIEIKE